jgi:isoleucyl-tRNA synthetase
MKFDESIFTRSAAQQEVPLVSHWKENKTFERSVNERPEENQYVMFDGPPFATGLPHHGHLLAHTLKDVFPRFWTMRGKRVERVFGWDCHGVPVESIAHDQLKKERGPSAAQSALDFDIKTFNDRCRVIVLRYAEEWKATEERIGRWIDMDNPYMTMDPTFMESVWATFKDLLEKGFIYRDKQVLDYSVKLHTTLSRNEIDMLDVSCTTATIQFRSEDEKILAWTTTPWTLPSNRGLAVHEDLAYVTVASGENKFIVSRQYYLSNPQDFPNSTIVEEYKGSELVGRRYEPLFPGSPADAETDSYKVISADFVKETSGTGVVHIAPAFGEDDYKVGKAHNLSVHDPFDGKGMRNDSIPELAGQIFFKTDPLVLEYLRANDALFKTEDITHSYAHCPRTRLPLMKRVRDSWFFDVEKARAHALELAADINWAPDGNAGDDFMAALKSLERWGLSRDRFWGTPIPMWQCEETGEFLCVGSIAELENLTGEKVGDLHYDAIGHLTIEKDGKTYVLKRELFDCWFESGSMPYGQAHYPFENKARMEASLPADFIAEGRDQTRLWFQRMHLIASANHNKPAFRNVVTNGIVLASDGSKMSKSAKNYKSPGEVIEAYGADALRFYMMSSPGARGERMRFDDNDVKVSQNQVQRPMWNVAKFFVEKANAEGWSADARTTEVGTLTGNEHALDRWLVIRFERFKKDITEAYEAYDCPTACGFITAFLDDLSNWYVRLSRKRFYKPEGYTRHFEILNDVLVELSQVTAPIMPFISENVYKTFTGGDSVHLTLWPEMHAGAPESEEETFAHMAQAKQIAEYGNFLRRTTGIRTRQPLSALKVHVDGEFPLETYADILAEELNVKSVERAERQDPAFSENHEYVSKTDKGVTVALCSTVTPELAQEGVARDLVHAIQGQRKKLGLNLDDTVEIAIEDNNHLLGEHMPYIANSVNGTAVSTVENPDFHEKVTVGSHTFTVQLRKVAAVS